MKWLKGIAYFFISYLKESDQDYGNLMNAQELAYS